MVISDIRLYFLSVTLKGLLGLKRLGRRGDLLEADIFNITVVINEDCCCGRSDLQLGNETWHILL